MVPFQMPSLNAIDKHPNFMPCLIHFLPVGVFWIQIQSVSNHISDPNGGSEHQRGGSMACWQVNGIYLG